jgi:hypothetical protein
LFATTACPHVLLKIYKNHYYFLKASRSSPLLESSAGGCWLRQEADIDIIDQDIILGQSIDRFAGNGRAVIRRLL